MGRNRLRLRMTGVGELRHAIRNYGDSLVTAAGRAVGEAVADTVREARAAAPVGVYPVDWDRPDGGRLRDSIRGTVRAHEYGYKGRVRAGVPYAAVIELGSERIKHPHPYLLPAAIGNRKVLNRNLRKIVVDLAPEGLGKPRVVGEGPGAPDVGIGEGSKS